MVYLIYPLMAICLFWGAKVCKKNEWNDEVMSFANTKAFLGFCSLAIILHHCAQRTCVPWIPVNCIVHGLDGFQCVGYICVATFFFCSGYGMYVSKASKKDFFVGYNKRIRKLLFPAATMWLTFFVIEKAKGMNIQQPKWIYTFSYAWFIYALLYMYVFFYLAFHVNKKEKLGLPIMVIAALIYAVFCHFFSPGAWWYCTQYMFVIGIVMARHKDEILAGLKKFYPVWMILSVIVTAVFFYVANYYNYFIALLGVAYNDSTHDTVELIGQTISAFSSVLFFLLIGMKVSVGNKVLKFLGTFTLEIYLVHPLFVQLFGFAFLQNQVKSLFYIKNVFLYALVVMAGGISLGYLLHRINAALFKIESKS